LELAVFLIFMLNRSSCSS